MSSVPGGGEAQTTVQISARIPRAHWEALERRATEADRTVSAELRRAIRQYIRGEDE